MNRYNGNRTPPSNSDNDPGQGATQPRRVGQIVHDDRGSASVEWRNAPANYDRPVFEIEDRGGSGRGDLKLRRGFEPKLEVKREHVDTFNPYDRAPDPVSGKAGAAAPQVGKGGKRDLKKLSEWLKLMKAMEERKQNGED